MPEGFEDALTFVSKFIEKEYGLWKANYTWHDHGRLSEAIGAFVREFFDFPVSVLIHRPASVTEAWFEEAKTFLSATIPRPLFKIDLFLLGGEKVYAAYTGSDDVGSNCYYEVLLFKQSPSGFRIFSVYHPDFEGGFKHLQGTVLPFSGAETEGYADVLRVQAPDDDLDLIDYGTEPA